jgi:hypothetical protein
VLVILTYSAENAEETWLDGSLTFPLLDVWPFRKKLDKNQPLFIDPPAGRRENARHSHHF